MSDFKKIPLVRKIPSVRESPLLGKILPEWEIPSLRKIPELAEISVLGLTGDSTLAIHNWCRGEARIEGEWVVLSQSSSEWYSLETATELVFDLASFPRPFRTTSVLDFVKRYGLLRYDGHGVEGREMLRDWLEVAHQFETLLSAYLAWTKQGHAEEYAEANKTESVFVDLLNQGLKSVHLQVIPGVNGVGPNEFIINIQVGDLVGLAYYQFALLLQTAQTIGICPECARYFAVKDKRVRYCSTKCAGRAKSRRYYEKKKFGKS